MSFFEQGLRARATKTSEECCGRKDIEARWVLVSPKENLKTVHTLSIPSYQSGSRKKTRKEAVTSCPRSKREGTIAIWTMPPRDLLGQSSNADSFFLGINYSQSFFVNLDGDI